MLPVVWVTTRVPDGVDHDELLAPRDTLLNDVVDDIRKAPQQVAAHSALIGCSRLWRSLDGDNGCLRLGGKRLAQTSGTFAVVEGGLPVLGESLLVQRTLHARR